MRAERLQWWMIMTAFEAANPKNLMLRTQCQSSGYSLTEKDHSNNPARNTIEAMTPVFGGTQLPHTKALECHRTADKVQRISDATRP